MMQRDALVGCRRIELPAHQPSASRSARLKCTLMRSHIGCRYRPLDHVRFRPPLSSPPLVHEHSHLTPARWRGPAKPPPSTRTSAPSCAPHRRSRNAAAQLPRGGLSSARLLPYIARPHDSSSRTRRSGYRCRPGPCRGFLGDAMRVLRTVSLRFRGVEPTCIKWIVRQLLLMRTSD